MINKNRMLYAPLQFNQNKIQPKTKNTEDVVSISQPKANITKYLLSTPSRFVGESVADSYYLVDAYDNYSRMSYSAKPDERIYRHYLELAVETPEDNKESIVIPDYTHIADSFCIALSVLFGKRFDSHGLTQQHRRAFIPVINDSNTIYNLKFRSSTLTINPPIPLI